MSVLLSRPRAAVLMIVLISVRATAVAEERLLLPGDQLQTVSEQMSPEKYRATCRRNQRLLRKMASGYATGALHAAGVPETGIRMLGATATLAAGGEAHLKLMKSRFTRLALEFRDAVDSDRSVVLGFRIRW